MDPGFVHLLGFVVDDFLYFDVVLTMGLWIACSICQRITNVLMFIYKRLSFEGINYLDDLGAAEFRNKAWQAFYVLGNLLRDLGIWEAEVKASPPSEIMVFLGVTCNSRTFTLEITKDRLEELVHLIKSWLSKRVATLRGVQSLAGKLVCSTVRSGRVFMICILNFLRSFGGKPGRRHITVEMVKDLQWWNAFLREFNGVTMFPELRWLPPDALISTDSCLSGWRMVTWGILSL